MKIDFDERLSAAQREYDEIEATLLSRLTYFRLYLTSKDRDERGQYEKNLSSDSDFKRWRALAAEINRLYGMRDGGA